MIGVRTLGLLAFAGLLVGCGESGGTAADSFDATAKKRSKWVTAEISEHNAWLSDEIREEKYKEMAESPLAFLRGTNHLYWADFADDSDLDDFGGGKSTRTFLQGDLHVGNFGSFHDDEGRVVFDVNDYDEAVVGDYQLDLWRGAVSIALLAEQQGLDEDESEDAVRAFAESYLDACESFVGSDDEEDRSVTADTAEGALADFLSEVESKKTRAKMLSKWTTVSDGERRLADDNEDLGPVDPEVQEALLAALPDYGATLSGGLDWDEAYFAPKDVALRLHAGVGSLGVPRYYLLIEGPSASLDDDVLLDIKLTPLPTGLAYLEDRSGFAIDAERAVAGQKALLTDTDNHLGWLELEDGSYAVRERSPFKEDFPLEDIEDAEVLRALAAQMGAILAADHARADRDYDDDILPASLEEGVVDAVDGERSKFSDRVWKVASSYAGQVEKDYKAFLSMIE